MAVSIGVALVVGVAVYAATQAALPSIPAQYREDKINQILNPDYNIPVIYGEQSTEGNIIFYDTTGTNNKYLDIICLISEGEIEGITKVYMDDGAIPIFDASLLPGSPSTIPDSSSSEDVHYSTNPLYGNKAASGKLRVYIDANASGGYWQVSTGGKWKNLGDIARNAADAATWLNASSDPKVSLATYTANGNTLEIEYDSAGTAGNSFSLGYTNYYAGFAGTNQRNVKLSGGTSTQYLPAYFYNGTDSQAANSVLTSAYSDWNSNCTLSGFAYMYIRLQHNPDLFSGSIPRFRFELKGRKVLDTRTSTTAYSTNNALCLYDYLTNTRFGKGLSTSLLNTASFNTAANDCDVLKDGTDVTSTPIQYKTYEIGAVVDTGQKIKDNVALFLQSMNGTLPYINGEYYLQLLKAGSATTTFDETNIIGQITVSSSNTNNRFNKVICTFNDKQRHYKKGDAILDPLAASGSAYSAEAAAYYAEDNNQLLEKRLNAPFINYYPRARDLAELTMNLSRRGLSISFTATSEALKAVPGDIVGVSYSLFGWSGKEFRIEKLVSRIDGFCDVTLSEHDDALYSLNDQQEQPDPETTSLQDPRVVYKPIITSVLSDSTTTIVGTDGIIYPRIFIEWEEVDDYAVEYFIYLKKSSDSSFIQVGQVPGNETLNYYIDQVEWDTDYDIGVATVNGVGYKSPISIVITTTPNPLTFANYDYPDVTGLELVGTGTNQGLGNTTEFTGKDIKIQWRLSSSNAVFEFGSLASEQMGGTGGVVPFTLDHYRVEVYHSGDTTPRQEYQVTQPNFVYSLDKNIEDGSGTPSRTVKFKVYAVGVVSGIGVSGESEIPAIIEVTNPQPSLPTEVTFSSGFQTINLDFTKPIDADYKNIRIWRSTSTGFTPTDNDIVYDGPDSHVQFTGLASGQTYYFLFSPYDDFGITGANTSSEYSVTTQSAITSGEIDTIIADKIAAGTLGEAVTLGGVFVASGTEAVLNGTGPATGTYRLDMGPVSDGGTTYVIRFHDNNGNSAFSIDSDGNAIYSGALSAASGTFNGTLSAGTVSGSNVIGSTLQGSSLITKGGFLTTATSGGETTIYLTNTSDFASSGSGWISDSTNQDDAFSWTGKTSTTLTGCSGVLAHAVDAVVIPQAQTMYISDSIGELEFHADRGDGTVENLGSIGIRSGFGDYVIASFGSSSSSRIGVYARTTNNYALVGQADSGYGCYGLSVSGTGVYGASTSSLGIYGYSTNSIGVSGVSTNNIAVRGNGATYDFYAFGGGTNYGPFTGGHDGLILKDSQFEQGDIVCDGDKFFNEGISQTIGEIVISDTPYSKSVIGVYNNRQELNDDRPAGLTNYKQYKRLQKKYNRVMFNALGEGMINVCGENGDIEVGDLIVSSSIPGKGMKQDDDIIRNYTVAKSRQSVKFKDKEQKQICCIYLCG